ncbi:uncharacterized protein MELLADRAFT_111713 [Melampsora larici-populina 98AG31]|uniref:F-box domain-containing protein n=1 Tax=Melampsora larici-populina (strain 98AG31 / pathotype 3-4-7) TaxID=747676 RepID=F4S4A6_MELLP|nr:uncharacterized protein MELLADRAFT_111713 [Melampsora larici-populina 98AG31]EGG00588.1 hypothetical protein MELLADRAFT_111713 [Melampsora larici-populina 98AG31]
MKSSDIGTVDISEHHKPMYGSELSFSKLATPVQKAILEVEHDMVLFGTKAVNAEDLVKYPTSEEIHSSTSYFTSLFSNLASLQHLKVDRNLAACFSNCKNLKRLVLSYVRGIEILQGSCTGPPNLVDLVIRNCPGLKLPHIPQLISSWAPHLTHFTLKLYEYEDPSLREDILDFDPRRNQFYLLGLTHLTIQSHSKSHYIQCFSSCKNLVQLTFVLCTSTTEEMPDGQADELSAVSDFITTNEFHRLQKIVLIKTDQNPIDSVSASALFPLEEFCRSKGIKLSGF